MTKKTMRKTRGLALGLLAVLALTSCGSPPAKKLLVSVKDQKIALIENGKATRVYGCSTSKYGLGDRINSFATPEGKMAVAKKIGYGAPPGMVFKGRQATGEVLAPNSPGRDPIVTRILWLSGKESKNRKAYGRCIYIHGTPEENRIGSPASYGCVRMRSMDVIDLFNKVPVGTEVEVTRSGLPLGAKLKGEYAAGPMPLPRRSMSSNALVTSPIPSTANTASARKLGPEVVR
jgi:hypothetical protein